jgi:predicted outer membrane repeat protein
VCLSGNFVISDAIIFGRDIQVKGVGDSSIEPFDSGGVFLSNELPEIFKITIETLSIRNAGSISNPAPAVFGLEVIVKDSTFQGNSYGAIFGGDVDVLNSTFIDNSAGLDNNGEREGGAIWADGSVIATNSTFVNNDALNGGAIYSDTVNIVNSTFLDNEASNEGGAIYSYAGTVYLSTFVNNLATPPSDSPGADTPGNAIYKEGRGDPPGYGSFRVGGNIFAGESEYPQLGYGAVPSQFIDMGGNVFSTPVGVEADIAENPGADPIAKHESTFFGADLIELFGTLSPSLETHQPNSSGTQTIALASGSPALNRVLETSINLTPLPTLDQRGAARSYPADSGAFEGFVSRSLATTGTTTPWWAAWYSLASLAIGGIAIAYAKRTRRRNR